MIDFGFPVGPITLIDEVGIDVGMHVLETIEKAFPSRMSSPKELAPVAESGRLRLFESRSGDLAGRTIIEELQVTLRRDLFNYLVANGDKNRVVQTYQDRPCYNLVKLKDLFDSILKIYKSTDSEADSVNLLFSYTYKKPICRVSPYVGTLTREVTVPSLTGQ